LGARKRLLDRGRPANSPAELALHLAPSLICDEHWTDAEDEELWARDDSGAALTAFADRVVAVRPLSACFERILGRSDLALIPAARAGQDGHGGRG
jgi:hypothetical protein